MNISKVLSNYRGVFGFGKSVVVRVSGARFREVYQEFVEQLRDPVVDEFTSVVGMKAADGKRELSDHLFEYRNQIVFRYLFRRGDYLELGHFVDRVDVVNPFSCIEIALMDRVHPDIARTSFRTRAAVAHRSKFSRAASL